MTTLTAASKACTVNPLKVSPALGAALAFLGIERCIPLFHGSQGCTAFALVLMVRHFREAIPLQTTAMSELATILGGADNVEQAIANLYARAKPALIGLCSTALTETRGEDMAADLRSIRERHDDWGDLDVVLAPTPDYAGSLPGGWAAAVTATIEALVPPSDGRRTLRQVNLLPGSHLTPGDVEELRDIMESFGLTAIVLPDISRSLDGLVPDEHVPTSLGGTSRDEIREMGHSVMTLAIGEHMRPCAEALARRTGVPFRLFPSVTGLGAADGFLATLIELSGSEPSARLKRERSRLIDAMLDAHFYFEDRDIGIAGEPDLLCAIADLVVGLGARVGAAVTTAATPSSEHAPVERIIIGDLDDFADAAADCDLLIANAHAEAFARQLQVPLFRAGFPIFDRLGAPLSVSVGYRGTRELIFALANLLIQHAPHPTHAIAALESPGVAHAQAQAG